MGVSILPRFAASVCNTTVGIINLCNPADLSTMSAKGTKVIRETSLVTTMLRKKGANTSTAMSFLEVFALFNSLFAR